MVLLGTLDELWSRSVPCRNIGLDHWTRPARHLRPFRGSVGRAKATLDEDMDLDFWFYVPCHGLPPEVVMC